MYYILLYYIVGFQVMARATKKDIYKTYGIEFDGNRINAPLFGFVPPLLVNGNDKIGKNVYHFSTLPADIWYHVTIDGETYETKGTCPCNCVGCYAQSGNFKRYPTTKIYLAIRTILSRKYLEFVKNAIIAQIKADNVKMLRIHASGDFFSEEYIAMWEDVVAACPDTIFWSYTKNQAAENAFDGFDNCNIVKSLIPNCGKNYGHCDYILETFAKLKAEKKSVYICRCGIDDNQHCNTCGGCSKNEYVLFIEHSTEYKAKKDVLFPTLKEIIDAQPQQLAIIR